MTISSALTARADFERRSVRDSTGSINNSMDGDEEVKGEKVKGIEE